MTQTQNGRIHEIAAILRDRYPDAICSLIYDGDPWRLLCGGRLSAQCTDERVNQVLIPLFDRYPDVYAMAAARQEDVEAIVRPCGLFRTKAASLIGMAQEIVTRYGGEVPGTMEDLLSLPGVGRKIANLILGDIFHVPGIVADTHCIRINGRLGFYPEALKDPVKVEKILSAVVPPEEQSDYCHRMVLFGRDVCMARSPACGICPLRHLCPHGEAATSTNSEDSPDD